MICINCCGLLLKVVAVVFHFLHDGRLLIAVGSQTNAGIPGALGLLPVLLTCAEPAC